MSSSTTSTQNTSTAKYTYSPSVPLSVYRELAAELQAVEATLDSLDAQNQQLARQNQQLRQEIEKAVQSVFHLKQVADSAGVLGWHDAHPASVKSKIPNYPAATRQVQRSQPPAGVQSVSVRPFPNRKTGSGLSEKISIEQEQGRYRRRSQPEIASQTSGWWLAIAILLIMVTAFSAGYLLVRPLLQNR